VVWSGPAGIGEDRWIRVCSRLEKYSVPQGRVLAHSLSWRKFHRLLSSRPSIALSSDFTSSENGMLAISSPISSSFTGLMSFTETPSLAAPRIVSPRE